MNDVDNFEQEVLTTVPRYISKPKVGVDIRMRHNETGEVISFAEAFPDEFEKWKTVRSLADRRGIIYSILDDAIGYNNELWQDIARYNMDRYAEKALKLANEEAQEADLASADYWASLAETNFILTNYPEAETNALTALQLDDNNDRGRRILADVYHCTKRGEQALSLYNRILDKKLPGDEPLTLSITELLGFDGAMLHSPIYALIWLKGSGETNGETWDWANEEFYFSPHFRSQHAFHLIQTKETMRGFAKLLTLSREMPWFHDAVVNSYNLIYQLKLAEKFAEDANRLKQVMAANKWRYDDPDLFKFTA